jgi:hypothetical protein
MLVHVVNNLHGFNGTYQVQKVQYVPKGNGQFEYKIDLGA